MIAVTKAGSQSECVCRWLRDRSPAQAPAPIPRSF